jgi:hypothetical protein
MTADFRRPYYYNSKLRIVTDAPIRHPNQQSSVEWCYAVFREQRKRALPSAADFYVFLDFNGNNTCRYYMIDHANRTVCWLRQRQISDVGIDGIRSVLDPRTYA